MGKNFFAKSRPVLALCIGIGLLLSNTGCHHQKTAASSKSPAPLPEIRKVVVMGFETVMSKGQKPDVVRDPLSGSVFMAEPVPRGVADRMTGVLFDRLVARKGYELVSPGQARGALSSIIDSDKNMGMDPVRIVQKVGDAFGADAVLAGYIYRWREREGGDYAVDRASSVAFSLHLIRPGDGAVLWKSLFDKTQKSLFENLLDASIFFKSGGKWMKVEKLAMLGLDKMLAQMPGAKKMSVKIPVKTGGEGED